MCVPSQWPQRTKRICCGQSCVSKHPCSFRILISQYRRFSVAAASYFEGDADFWEAEGERSTVHLVMSQWSRIKVGFSVILRACDTALQRPHIPQTSNWLRRKQNNSNCLVPISEGCRVQSRLFFASCGTFLLVRNPLSFLTYLSFLEQVLKNVWKVFAH